MPERAPVPHRVAPVPHHEYHGEHENVVECEQVAEHEHDVIHECLIYLYIYIYKICTWYEYIYNNMYIISICIYYLHIC